MARLAVLASPLLAVILAALYWIGFVEAEVMRYYEPSGKRWPPLRQRAEEKLRIPAATHFYGITAALFTFTVTVMADRPHPAGVVITVVLLLVYLFYALYSGPAFRVVPVYEGIAQMAAATNFALYLSVRKWSPAWLTIQNITFWEIIGTLAVCVLVQLYLRRRRQRPS